MGGDEGKCAVAIGVEWFDQEWGRGFDEWPDRPERRTAACLLERENRRLRAAGVIAD